jgi:CMP-N-acetylneuraminic acid synthetase
VALVAGRPMIAYTVDAALESGCFDAVYVSTEDEEIARIADRTGARVHPRPVELAGDLVSATDVCIEVADARDSQGERHESLICLQPSSPLRTADDIVRSVERFEASGADYLVSVTPIDPHYFHWAVKPAESGWWRMWFGTEFLKERPLLPPVFRPNGAIKIGKLAPLRASRNFFGEKLAVVEMAEQRSLHVGEPADLELADYLLRRASEERS